MNGAPILVAQLEIRNNVARRRHMIEHSRLVIRLGLRDHNDVIQHYGLFGTLRHQHVRRNRVAGVQLAGNGRVLELVGHGHCIHEARNGLMIHNHDPVRRVGRNYLPTQVINRRR